MPHQETERRLGERRGRAAACSPRREGASPAPTSTRRLHTSAPGPRGSRVEVSTTASSGEQVALRVTTAGRRCIRHAARLDVCPRRTRRSPLFSATTRRRVLCLGMHAMPGRAAVLPVSSMGTQGGAPGAQVTEQPAHQSVCVEHAFAFASQHLRAPLRATRRRLCCANPLSLAPHCCGRCGVCS